MWHVDKLKSSFESVFDLINPIYFTQIPEA